MAGRSTVLAATTGPADLSTHVLAHLFGRLDGQTVCAAEEPQFLAPAYRWSPIVDILRELPPDEPADDRAAEWQARLGRPVLGRTIGEQTEAAQFWMDTDVADPALRRAVLLGRDSPSPIEAAIGVGQASPDWTTRLNLVLPEVFVADDWMEQLLAVPSIMEP